MIAAGRHPELVDALALDLSGASPPRRRLAQGAARRSPGLSSRIGGRSFPIPLSDPALFTDNPEGQAFIAADPYSLRRGTAGLMAASFIIDRLVALAPAPRPPAGLADAGGPGSDR